MKLALFAAGPVGRRVAELLAERRVPLACLVLHTDDPGGQNDAIREVAAGTGATRLLASDELEQGAGLEGLRGLALDLGILAWWPQILRPELVGVPSLGFLNLHPSFLPHNRGKDPNFWAILEGRPHGVTIHFVDDAVDAGDIVFQEPIEVTWEDTGQSLYAKAQEAIVALFADKLDQILAGDLPRTPQDPSIGSYHRRAELAPASHIELDRTYTARDLLNILRARTFAGHSAARFTDGGDAYEVRVSIQQLTDEQREGVPRPAAG